MKFILTLGPGSGADIGARLFADRLAQRWGQLVVENRPGGNGIVAINAFVGVHDDHQLLFSPTSCSRRTRFCTIICHTGRAIWRRLRESPTPSSLSRCPRA